MSLKLNTLKVKARLKFDDLTHDRENTPQAYAWG
jgi:hypothetical protein